MPRRILEDEKIKVARELRRRGLTLEEISNELGISIGSAWKYTQDLTDDRIQTLYEMVDWLSCAVGYALGRLGVDPVSEEWDKVWEPYNRAHEKWKRLSKKK